MKQRIIKLSIAAALFLFTTVNNYAQDDARIDSLAQRLGDLGAPESLGDTVLSRNEFQADDSMQGYKNDRDFAYMKYLDSLLRNTKDLTIDTFSINNATSSRNKEVQRQPGKKTSSPQLNIFSNPVVKIVLWVLAIFLIGYLLWKLFLGENFFRRNPTHKPVADTEAEGTDISDPSAYDSLIASAVMNKNYRLAIRYSYLQTLKKLAGTGLLQFAPDKTNYQYVNELRGRPWQNDFAAITLNYEYVWYGKFDIEEHVYRRLAADYKNFNQKL